MKKVDEAPWWARILGSLFWWLVASPNSLYNRRRK